MLYSDVPNPCNDITCGPGALCRPTSDGRTYNCECPTSCPSYGDHEGSRPLCASDARDYPGECEMRRAACESNSSITFKYYGKCGEYLSRTIYYWQFPKITAVNRGPISKLLNEVILKATANFLDNNKTTK